MAEKNNATCSICDKGYHICLSCRDSIQLAPWKVHTDTSEHYKIFQIIRGYSTGMYDKDESKAKLKNVDLSDLNTFRPHIKKIIKDILKESIAKPTKKIEVAEKLTADKVGEAEAINKNVVVDDVALTAVSHKENNKAKYEVVETE